MPICLFLTVKCNCKKVLTILSLLFHTEYLNMLLLGQKKESTSSFSQIMLRPRPSSKFDVENMYLHFRHIIISYWTVLLTCLSEGTCQSQVSTTLFSYYICLRWSYVLHSSLYGTVYWFYYSVNRNYYSFLLGSLKKKKKIKWEKIGTWGGHGSQ